MGDLIDSARLLLIRHGHPRVPSFSDSSRNHINVYENFNLLGEGEKNITHTDPYYPYLFPINH